MSKNINEVIQESFLQYSGAVLQSRVLVDARDAIKPSARQILFAMYENKLTYDKDFEKTQKTVGYAFTYYIHGDSSLTGIVMRLGQTYAMRYPLIEVEGTVGTLIEPNSHAAPRYTSSRLSPLGTHMFEDLDKDTITDWRENYDGKNLYPGVLPSKGFFNIVNGTQGIGVALAASIPQFNLKEVNAALIKLLWNPDVAFEEIYCPPDFATGALLINEPQVKESLRKGTGSACKLRAVSHYDMKDNAIIVTEIPYNVYTNTICGELDVILESQDNPGIERYIDLTGETPNIKIYLSKKTAPENVLQYLYRNTSLQSHFGINLNMLHNGRQPKLYTWKELLQERLEHEREIYIRAFNFDLKKIEARLHILEGYIKAHSIIMELVKAIKSSSNKATAKTKLINDFGFTELQSEAILKLTLSRLTNMEIFKFEEEMDTLSKQREYILKTLSDENLLKKVLEKGFQDISNKFGDARRTKLIELNADEGERLLFFTKSGKIYLNRPKNEAVVKVLLSGNTYLAVSRSGTVFRTTRKPDRASKIFNIGTGDEIIDVFPENIEGFLVLYTVDKKFRCLEVKNLNKSRTKLNIENIDDAYVSDIRVGKGEYRKTTNKNLL